MFSNSSIVSSKAPHAGHSSLLPSSLTDKTQLGGVVRVRGRLARESQTVAVEGVGEVGWPPAACRLRCLHSSTAVTSL